MSEHSVEELKRQWESAEGAARTASARAHEAKRRYHEARFEATGFAGCIAEFTRTRWKKPAETVRFLPKRISRFGDEIEGNLIKKDGTEGEREVHCPVSMARNLGPWTGRFIEPAA